MHAPLPTIHAQSSKIFRRGELAWTLLRRRTAVLATWILLRITKYLWVVVRPLWIFLWVPYLLPFSSLISTFSLYLSLIPFAQFSHLPRIKFASVRALAFPCGQVRACTTERGQKADEEGCEGGVNDSRGCVGSWSCG